MKIYLDTSSLIKLYHTEIGTKELDEVFETNKVNEVFVSSISRWSLTLHYGKKLERKI